MNKDQLLSFAGMCEYYSKFVNNFASKMEPLRKLLRQNASFDGNLNNSRHLIP